MSGREDFFGAVDLRLGRRRIETPKTSRKESITERGSKAGTVVLVHGGFVDGSGWKDVYNLLKKDGYHVSVVQNPTLSLEGDVAATKQVIDEQDEPVTLVGHS